MSVQVESVTPLDVTGPLTDKVKLEIVFTAYEDIPDEDELDWEMLFAWDGDKAHDIPLEAITVGAIRTGRHSFVFEADAPDYSKVNEDDLMDVSVLFLQCTFREQLFCKAAFFVSYQYKDEELQKNPPEKLQLDQLERTIYVKDARVTHYPIRWNENDNLEPPEQEENDDDDIAFALREPEADNAEQQQVAEVAEIMQEVEMQDQESQPDQKENVAEPKQPDEVSPDQKKPAEEPMEKADSQEEPELV